MRITSAATSHVAATPSPRGNPFREGQSPSKDKRRARSIKRVLSTPIRKMGRQLSKRSGKKSPSKDNPEQTSHLPPRDEEQGWITHATTFETDDMSPRSFDSLTTSDSTSLLQTHEKEEEEISDCTIIGSLQHNQPDGFLDLEAPVHESAETSKFFEHNDGSQEDVNGIAFNENESENYSEQNAAPHTETDLQDFNEEASFSESDQENSSIHNKSFSVDSSMAYEDHKASAKKVRRVSILSVLSASDTIDEADEADEFDSLVPAADISFFLEEEGCSSNMSTIEAPPIEIDIDNKSDTNHSKNSCAEDNSHERDNEDVVLFENDDDAMSTNSYDSYLKAIQNITASANFKVERAMSMAIDKTEIKKQTYKSPKKEFKHEPQVEEEYDDGDDDDDSFHMSSFKPSNELLIQAMEGASAKARMDIERATALALSKINSLHSLVDPDKPKTTTKYAHNRVLGFIFLLFSFLTWSTDSFQFFKGIRSISHSAGIDDFQMQQYNNVLVKPQPDRSMRAEKQEIPAPIDSQVEIRHERGHNIGCVHKVGCLALGAL